MLEIVGVCKNFDSVCALDHVSMTIGDSGLYAILGESGSGKSTLFHVLTGAVKAEEGQVRYNGQTLNTDGKINSENVFGIVFQDCNLLSGLTARQNLSVCCADRQKQNEILQTLRIDKYANTDVAKLSGGEKQRVAIARALLDASKILLADEPTGSLDDKNGEKVMALLREIAVYKPVLMITHNTDFALRYADRLFRMRQGRLEEDRDFLPTPVHTEHSASEQNIHTDTDDVANKSVTRELSPSLLCRYCASKTRHSFAKQITSACLLALTVAIIVLCSACLMADCRGVYWDSIRDYTYSALYDEGNMLTFAQKLEGIEDRNGLTRYYHYSWLEGQSTYIVVDDSLADDEIILGAETAEKLNANRLVAIQPGDKILYHGRELSVRAIAARQKCAQVLNLNASVYLNDKTACDIMLAQQMILLDANYRLELHIIADESLSAGQCTINFHLYHNLGSRDPDYIDLQNKEVKWQFDAGNTVLYAQNFTIVSVDMQDMEQEDNILVVSPADYAEISRSRLYYGYLVRNADHDAVADWTRRGFEPYNADFDAYRRSKDLQKALFPYALAGMAAGLFLSGLYLYSVVRHVAETNLREVYILRALRVGDRSIFGILALQLLPSCVLANVFAFVLGIVAQIVVRNKMMFFVLPIWAGAGIAALFCAILTCAGIAWYIRQSNRNFDIHKTR